MTVLGCDLSIMTFFFMFMSALPACMYVFHMCAWSPQRAGDGAESLGTSDKDSWELSCECWELNLDPLEGEEELLAAEPSL